jgi:hypothetical protein
MVGPGRSPRAHRRIACPRASRRDPGHSVMRRLRCTDRTVQPGDRPRTKATDHAFRLRWVHQAWRIMVRALRRVRAERCEPRGDRRPFESRRCRRRRGATSTSVRTSAIVDGDHLPPTVGVRLSRNARHFEGDPCRCVRGAGVPGHRWSRRSGPGGAGFFDDGRGNRRSEHAGRAAAVALGTAPDGHDRRAARLGSALKAWRRAGEHPRWAGQCCSRPSRRSTTEPSVVSITPAAGPGDPHAHEGKPAPGCGWCPVTGAFSAAGVTPTAQAGTRVVLSLGVPVQPRRAFSASVRTGSGLLAAGVWPSEFVYRAWCDG